MKLPLSKEELDKFESRLQARIMKTYLCWYWTGTLSDGYGRIVRKGKYLRVHRIMYEKYKGKIPKGKVLDHKCRNRACCNPDHLEIVTSKDNILRGVGAFALNSKKTHCVNGHEFDGNNTGRDHRGNRFCKTCQRKYWRENWRKKNGVTNPRIKS